MNHRHTSSTVSPTSPAVSPLQQPCEYCGPRNENADPHHLPDCPSRWPDLTPWELRFHLRLLEHAVIDLLTTNEVPKRTVRSMNGARRALDYRKGVKRFHRCSRCHAEHETAPPIIYNADGSASESPMSAIMVGATLLGFACNDCINSLMQHISSAFPENLGFPLVDHHGQLVSTPRCDDCGAALAYATDGRSVLCPQCDVEHL
jgi:hypothetical protein